MLIDCPACARSYHVSREDIGLEGRTVICPRCQSRWFVDGDGETARDVTVAAASGRPDHATAAQLRMPPPRRRGPWAAAVVVVGLVAAMAGLGLREPIVRAVPRLAHAYAAIGLPVNLRGLEIAKVTSARVDRVRLAVTGEIHNIAQRRMSVPRLAFEIRDAAGVDLVRWSERPSTRSLAAGQTLAFAAVPHDAPDGAQSVNVHFEP